MTYTPPTQERLDWLMEELPHPTLGMKFPDPRYSKLVCEILDKIDAFGGSTWEAVETAIWITAQVILDDTIVDFPSFLAANPGRYDDYDFS